MRGDSHKRTNAVDQKKKKRGQTRRQTNDTKPCTTFDPKKKAMHDTSSLNLSPKNASEVQSIIQKFLETQTQKQPHAFLESWLAFFFLFLNTTEGSEMVRVSLTRAEIPYSKNKNVFLVKLE